MIYEIEDKNYQKKLFNNLYKFAFNTSKEQIIIHRALGLTSKDETSCNMETPIGRTIDKMLEALVCLMMKSDNYYYKVMGHLINDTYDVSDCSVFDDFIDYTTTLDHGETTLDSFLNYLFYTYEEEIRLTCNALHIDYDNDYLNSAR